MTSTVLKRLTSCAAASLLALSFQVVGATTTSGCGDADSCASVRDSTYAALETWQACTPGDTCILEPGNPKDCSGVLTCEFAINPAHRAEAEEAMLSIGEQTRGCYQCSVPNCMTGSEGYCEPISRRCIVVVAVEDGGVVTTAPPTNTDSGLGSIVLGDSGADGL